MSIMGMSMRGLGGGGVLGSGPAAVLSVLAW